MMVYHVMPVYGRPDRQGSSHVASFHRSNKNSARQTFLYRRNRTYSRQCYCLTSVLNITYHMWAYVKYCFVYNMCVQNVIYCSYLLLLRWENTKGRARLNIEE